MCWLVFAKNYSCVDLAKQIIHCCFSCVAAHSCFSCLVNASCMEAYTCSYMLLNASYTCHVFSQMMILVWEQGDFKPMNACYSPCLFWEGVVVVLAQLFPLPAFLCLILSSARWLPAGPTCPLVSAQIRPAVQETGNILSETLPGCVLLLGNFQDVNFVFSQV